ncbi:hypothetical protein CBM2615_B150079 [Cupriavidus taiwanensis]|uniref:Uncharacterized protein n=1 Tax=Cupriavidus taiwanensis TaxID=164546 RepID=A0A375E7I0_9BURK|nr:hypothetical protein [Cupriavidus taiwanensis]SOZ64368.1 hypothetical protein CBM2614_B160082 [Cupriavidus taiwanensis]SOZ65076.1 hypothetical protein CBM2615_B150079 [Cupriavidus taiwanensis]SOZ68773.1 hypothetical protein CBM2613_B120079 [Cupriavidus taiwanensis]SPA08188.1 hypothetical protein CBM2625_B120077 [Cupriavidus taiwanensis]
MRRDDRLRRAMRKSRTEQRLSPPKRRSMTSPPTPADLCKTFAAGTLAASLARDFDLTNPADVESATQTCVVLHNAGAIDLLQLIEARQIAALDAPDRLRAIDRFGDLLPALDVSPERLLRLLDVHVTPEDPTGFSYRLQAAYRAWCRVRPTEARRLVAAAAAGDAVARGFLAPALEATQDPQLARDTAGSADALIRGAAIAVLGNLEDHDAASRAATAALFHTLATNCPDADTHAQLLRAWAAMVRRGVPEANSQTVPLLRRLLALTDEAVLQEAAQMLWSTVRALEKEAIGLLLEALAQVRADQTLTLKALDLACYTMLEAGLHAEATAFVTQLVTRADEPPPPDAFGRFMRALATGPTARLSPVIVHWLLLGDHRLCDGLLGALHTQAIEGAPIYLDPAALEIPGAAHLLLCEKAVGWFFVKPITAASILVSVLRVCAPDTAVGVLALLTDPLLRNYSCVRDYLRTLDAADAERVAPAVAAHDAYHAALEGVPYLPELRPSEHRRRIERLRAADHMRKAHKDAQQQSVLMPLVSRSVLLYGNRTLTYRHTPAGAPEPVEMDLRSFGVSVEMPSMQFVDPVALDYQLLMLRRKRMNP